MHPPIREERTASEEHVFIARLLDETREKNEGYIWTWNPKPQIALGPRSHREPFLSSINIIAENAGLEVSERNTGGLPLVHNGCTVGFAWTQGVDKGERDVEKRYELASDALRDALGNLGVDASVDCRQGEMCMGRYSLYLDGKVAGISQRVKKSAALTEGVVFLDSDDVYAEIAEDVYSAIDEEFNDETIDGLQWHIDVGIEDVKKEIEDVFQREFGSTLVQSE